MEWLTGVEPEIASHPSLQSFKSVGDLAKSWVNAQGMIGAEKLVLPKDEKDVAGWNQVYDKLGRPTDPSGYKMPAIEGLPEGMTIEETRVKDFLTQAHGLGLTQRQAAALYESHIKNQAGLLTQFTEQQVAAKAAAEKALRVEWGTGFEAQVSLAKKTLAWAAGDDAAALAQAYGNDPRFLRALTKLGNAMSEDVLGPGAPKPGDLTPEAAQKEIHAIMGDMKHPYFLADHPEHKAAVDRMTQLQEQAHPGALIEA